MKEQQVADLLGPILLRFALELEAVEIIPAGRRRLLRVVVDGDGPEGRGPLLDELAEASKALSAALDSSSVVGDSPYTLEVSSRGISRPLQQPRHWRRNLGRLVAVTTGTGERYNGRIVASSEDTAVLEADGQRHEIALADVAKALVQVELNRPLTDAADQGEEED
jgi:ribosome maturation factor RimP